MSKLEREVIRGRQIYERDDRIYIKPETFESVIAQTYRDNPDLIPFNDGDRAWMLGKESAAEFAKRKLNHRSYGKRGQSKPGSSVTDA